MDALEFTKDVNKVYIPMRPQGPGRNLGNFVLREGVNNVR